MTLVPKTDVFLFWVAREAHMQNTLDQRLKTARVATEAAANKSDREFWVAFDEIEAYTLDPRRRGSQQGG